MDSNPSLQEKTTEDYRERGDEAGRQEVQLGAGLVEQHQGPMGEEQNRGPGLEVLLQGQELEEHLHGPELDEQLQGPEGLPGEKEKRVAEAAKLHLVLSYDGKKFESEVKKLMASAYERTRRGGERYGLAIIYHDDVLLHTDQQEEVNKENPGDPEEDIPGFDPPRKYSFVFPESPARIEEIVALLKAEKSQGISIWDSAEVLSKRRLVTLDEATLVHDKDLFDETEGFSQWSYEKRNKYNLDNWQWSVFCGEGSSVAARLAAGSLLEGIDRVFKGVREGGGVFMGVVFCIVRPPGHHCSKKDPFGFCLLNNCAIGAHYAVSSLTKINSFLFSFKMQLQNICLY